MVARDHRAEYTILGHLSFSLREMRAMKLLVFSLVSVIVWSVYFSKEPHISEKSNSVALAEAATPTQELPDTKSENQSPRKIAAAMPLHAEANIDSEIEVEDEIDLLASKTPIWRAA